MGVGHAQSYHDPSILQCGAALQQHGETPDAPS
jgi:hypothetical protein